LLERCLRGEMRPDIMLAQIEELEPEVQAWVEVAPRDAGFGALSGVPFGVKDIIETEGMATEYGSPLFKGRKGSADAAIVSHFCGLDATLFGKTHTTAFAFYDAAPTRNPNAPGRTPGGSSSGSAAAVAAQMAAFAIGSQTQGSVIRPASFCGVCGFKPGYGVLPLEGVLPFAPTLDTAGLFTETARDMQLLWCAMGHAMSDPPPLRAAIPISGFDAEEPMTQALGAAATQLTSHGWQIETVDMPEPFLKAGAAVVVINRYEGARTHEAMWREHGPAVGVKLAALIEHGLATPEEEYRAALAVLAAARESMEMFFEKWPLVLTPAAPGPAPLGYESTGDPRMNAPWTGIGVPAMTVPMPCEGSPLGLQITCGKSKESALLAAAVNAASVL